MSLSTSTGARRRDLPRNRPGRLASLMTGVLMVLAAVTPAAAAPNAGAWLVFDARSGEVLARHNADQAWYPASVTKLMTTWVTFQAIRAGRISATSLVPMTAAASRQPPSKMGFKPGEVVTVDNALKIIMVKSANDVAYALAEAVGGSKEAFVSEMNRQARLLGMSETHFNNPHGLPDSGQVTTARDLGLLARALLREFPEAEGLWHLPGIQIGNEVIRNHNHLIDHFPGADGMKTGFICSSGFNVVASATRGNRRLVAVVLGAQSARSRAELAAELFTKGFENGGGGLFGRFTAPDTIDQMARGPEAHNPPRDVKKQICGPKKDRTPDPEDLGTTEASSSSGRESSGALVRPGSPEAAPVRTSYLTERFEPGPPVRVWVGGPEDAPAGVGDMLALAPDPGGRAAPLFAGAPATVPMGAIRPRVPMPPPTPGMGTGLEAALPPADGRPLHLGTPGAIASHPSRPVVEPQKTKTSASKPTKAKPAAGKKPAAVKSEKPVKKLAEKAMPPRKPTP